LSSPFCYRLCIVSVPLNTCSS